MRYTAAVRSSYMWLLLGVAFLIAFSARAATPGDLLKLECTGQNASTCSTVYYLAQDGRRYVFPNERVYRSWYADFSALITVSEAEMAAYELGGVVTYKPGVRLVKIESDPRVYAVGRGGLLHWIIDEGVAERLYGSGWARVVDDIPSSFFSHYTISAPVVSPLDYDPASVRDRIVTIDEDKGFAEPSGTYIPQPEPEPEPITLPLPLEPFIEPENDQLPALLAWAAEREIDFVGVRYDLAYLSNKQSFDPVTDGAALTDIPRTNFLYTGLQTLPPHLIHLLRGEIIYLSTEVCTSSVGGFRDIFDPTYDPFDETQKVYVPEGLYSSWGGVYLEPLTIFMCQKYADDWAIVHEVGHMVDLVGIRMHKGREFLLQQTDADIRAFYDEYERVFQIPPGLPDPTLIDLPPGFMSSYATWNILENFADHFAYYIFLGPSFREQMATDPLLTEKYNFFKDHIFLGQEYGT